MNMFTTLKSLLESTTGYKAYPVKKPLAAAVPCVVYNQIAAREIISHDQNEKLTTSRMQVTAVHTTYSGLRNLEKLIRNSLVANDTSWEVSYNLETSFDDYDEEDNLYSNTSEYYICYLND